MAARDYFERKVSALDKEWSSFESHMREISAWIEPRAGRFMTSDVNKGDKRHQKIINSKAIIARRTASSGFFAGTMSPSRPWLKFETVDRSLMLIDSVAQWIYEVEETMRSIFAASNLYSMAPIFLDELMTFGTAAMSHLDDFDNVARYQTHTIGSYRIGQNSKGEVDTFVLKKQMTALQMKNEFGGESRLSETVKNALTVENTENWFDVVQVIEPNPDYNPDALESKFKKFRSVWYEPNNPDKDMFLRESGFDEFPVYVVRYSITGEDIYGTNCPGMVALGDIKALQEQERQKAIGVAKLMSPMLKGPMSLRNSNIKNASNGLVIYDAENSREGLSPVYQINPGIQELRIDMAAVEERIDEAFFVDLFKTISNMKGVQPRNQLELSTRMGESLLLLGPPLERVQREFLAKMADRTFNQMARADLLPPPPPELEGQALEARFISAIAQAQQSVDVSNIERFVAFAGQLAGIKPEALDKLDADNIMDLYAQFTGVVPSVNKDNEAVAEEREARAAAVREQQESERNTQQASANVQNASAAKQLSEIE